MSFLMTWVMGMVILITPQPTTDCTRVISQAIGEVQREAQMNGGMITIGRVRHPINHIEFSCGPQPIPLGTTR